MILDTVAHLQDYRGLLPRVSHYLAFIKAAPQLKTGRYELESGDFAMIQEGMTQPQADGLFESHREYADLQVILTGREWMEWQDIEQLTCVRPFEATGDIAQYQGQGSLVEVTAGCFYFVLPQDGHKPGVHPTQANPYRKIVFKVKLDHE